MYRAVPVPPEYSVVVYLLIILRHLRVSKSEASSPTLDEQLTLKTGRTMLLGALVILISQHV